MGSFTSIPLGYQIGGKELLNCIALYGLRRIKLRVIPLNNAIVFSLPPRYN